MSLSLLDKKALGNIIDNPVIAQLSKLTLDLTTKNTQARLTGNPASNVCASTSKEAMDLTIKYNLDV